jgi:hypothetical protein
MTEPLSTELSPPGSDPAPRSRRRARHIQDNYYIGPARDPEVLEIWAYTDRFSYAPGETVGLRVSTTAEHYDIEIGRDGAEYVAMRKWTGLRGVRHETPEDCSVKGCDWPSALDFAVPLDWPSGGYLITLRGYRDGDSVEEHHLILVRQGVEIAPMLLLCATGTWVAYNCWGGSSAYEGITGPDGRQFSPVLSTQRPWTRGFCRLPKGAPRALPEAPANPGEMVRYPYMEWAYAYGYSKKYASAGWASYERHFARWAERQGYRLDYAALHDLEDDPGLLDGYRCVAIVGHDEYWTAGMRKALDSWVETGGRLARFAGNFMWQIRLANQGRTQICYKYIAGEADPVVGTPGESLMTGAWEMPGINWPGAQTFGVNGLQGVYAGLGNCVGRGSGGFTIYRPEHWAFRGAHLGYGDVLGAASRIFGYEVDGLDHVVRGGLPYVTGDDGASEEITILALGLATMAEADHEVWGEHLYVGSREVAWKASTLFGEITPETLERSKRGNGVMIHWPRGKGEVFTAATCEWVMGLTRGDFQVEQITRNVLTRFCS